jgi:hypothetical protein
VAIIEIPVGPPYGTIPVNTSAFYSAVPHPAAPSSASDLLIDSSGARSIQALVSIDQIGGMLGGDFAEFKLADVGRLRCFVNRTSWVSIVPHPQICGVVQINFANHYIAVVGTVVEVRKKLQSSPAVSVAKAAKRPRARPRRSVRSQS